VFKYVVSAWIGPETARDRVPIVGDALALEYVENTGAAFGVMAGRTWLLAFLAVAVSVFLVTTWRKSLPDNPWMQVGVGLVLGGASGNLIDRLRLGYVIDFIAVGPWPRFNLADSAITVGLAILFLAVLKDDGDGRTTH
jgi:signal peptidase II